MLCHLRSRRTALAPFGFALCVVSAGALAVGLNDTGQTLCYDGAGLTCSSTSGGDGSAAPRQDARYGRDAAAAALQLVKIGAGSAGFDYTKIANNGSALAATAVLGSNAGDWACTKDNVTGLTWEVKATTGLRTNSYLYLWYSTDATRNGGNAGNATTNAFADSCGNTLGTVIGATNACNTQKFASAVNAVGMCGKNDWRLPTQAKILSLAHAGKTDFVGVDGSYFPNTLNSQSFWTNSTSPANPVGVRMTETYYASQARITSKSDHALYFVRLVREGL